MTAHSALKVAPDLIKNNASQLARPGELVPSRYAVQVGQIPAAHRFGARMDQPDDAVDAVFDRCAIEAGAAGIGSLLLVSGDSGGSVHNASDSGAR